jgi:hypothetical protein
VLPPTAALPFSPVPPAMLPAPAAPPFPPAVPHHAPVPPLLGTPPAPAHPATLPPVRPTWPTPGAAAAGIGAAERLPALLLGSVGGGGGRQALLGPLLGPSEEEDLCTPSAWFRCVPCSLLPKAAQPQGLG